MCWLVLSHGYKRWNPPELGKKDRGVKEQKMWLEERDWMGTLEEWSQFCFPKCDRIHVNDIKRLLGSQSFQRACYVVFSGWAFNVRVLKTLEPQHRVSHRTTTVTTTAKSHRRNKIYWVIQLSESAKITTGQLFLVISFWLFSPSKQKQHGSRGERGKARASLSRR